MTRTERAIPSKESGGNRREEKDGSQIAQETKAAREESSINRMTNVE
jgi:hypothetical protein